MAWLRLAEDEDLGAFYARLSACGAVVQLNHVDTPVEVYRHNNDVLIQHQIVEQKEIRGLEEQSAKALAAYLQRDTTTINKIYKLREYTTSTSNHHGYFFDVIGLRAGTWAAGVISEAETVEASAARIDESNQWKVSIQKVTYKVPAGLTTTNVTSSTVTNTSNFYTYKPGNSDFLTSVGTRHSKQLLARFNGETLYQIEHIFNYEIHGLTYQEAIAKMATYTKSNSTKATASKTGSNMTVYFDYRAGEDYSATISREDDLSGWVCNVTKTVYAKEGW